MKALKILVISPLFSCLIFLLTGCALFGGTPSATETVRFVVKDQDGVAVSGAEVSMEWYRGESVSGLTDGDGVVTLTASGASGLTCGVSREGYYSSGGKIFDAGFTSLKDAGARGVRVHMNPLYMRGGMYLTRPPEEISIELKKIKEPVSMYVRRIKRLLPALNEKIGFDFEVGDWVAPHGRGSRPDVIFEGSMRYDDWNNYDNMLEVTLGSSEDGIMAVGIPEDRELNSYLRSPTIAPADGYSSNVLLSKQRSPDAGIKSSGLTNLIYLLRVRTEVDSEGNTIAANYGKIYNVQYVSRRTEGITVIFDYYFNPNRKSRSLEYNGTNLFKKAETTKPIWRPGFPPPQKPAVDPEIDRPFDY